MISRARETLTRVGPIPRGQATRITGGPQVKPTYGVAPEAHRPTSAEDARLTTSSPTTRGGPTGLR